MKSKKRLSILILSALGMLALILDAKTGIRGAQKGLEMILQAVIPSLFPLIFLSGVCRQEILTFPAKLLSPIGRLCRLPKGSEPVWLAGLLTGYPVGAMYLDRFCAANILSVEAASRMLPFVNNPGPAFLFGMLGMAFPQRYLLWILWLLQFVSATLTGFVLPSGHADQQVHLPKQSESLQAILLGCVKSMAMICAWILLFRVLLSFLEKWLFWAIPLPLQVVITGLLELANGALALTDVQDPALRFVIAAFLLSFGGLCVTMQTASCARHLRMDRYLPGKLLQSVISLCLAVGLCPILFPGNSSFAPSAISLCLLGAGICLRAKNNTGNYPAVTV